MYQSAVITAANAIAIATSSDMIMQQQRMIRWQQHQCIYMHIQK